MKIPDSSAVHKAIFVSVLSENTKVSLLPVLRGVLPNVAIKTFKSLSQMSEDATKSNNVASCVFIEFGFPMKQIAECLTCVRSQAATKPDTIILLIDEDLVNNELVSDYMRIGISGFVTRPFSEDSVSQVLKVSERLGELGSIAKLKVATKLEIKNMLDARGDRFDGSSVLSTVKRACDKFETENPGISAEKIAQSYSLMSPQERLKPKLDTLYRGSSNRVRRLVQGFGKKE